MLLHRRPESVPFLGARRRDHENQGALIFRHVGNPVDDRESHLVKEPGRAVVDNGHEILARNQAIAGVFCGKRPKDFIQNTNTHQVTEFHRSRILFKS